MIQKFLPLLPEGAEPVNKNLAIFRDQGEIIFFNGYCPMLKCSDSNPCRLRFAGRSLRNPYRQAGTVGQSAGGQSFYSVP